VRCVRFVLDVRSTFVAFSLARCRSLRFTLLRVVLFALFVVLGAGTFHVTFAFSCDCVPCTFVCCICYVRFAVCVRFCCLPFVIRFTFARVYTLPRVSIPCLRFPCYGYLTFLLYPMFYVLLSLLSPRHAFQDCTTPFHLFPTRTTTLRCRSAFRCLLRYQLRYVFPLRCLVVCVCIPRVQFLPLHLVYDLLIYGFITPRCVVPDFL